MTYKLVFSDVAQTTLATGIAANSPSLQVLAGAGALFPVLTANQAFLCTLFKNGSPSIWETVLVTGHTAGSDNFTGLVRNYEGNGVGALSWSAGDTVAIVPTAGGMNSFIQAIDLQAQQPNYAIDVGSANAYRVNLTPALNGHVIGMPIRFMAAHSNTGLSFFNDGIAQAPLVTTEGQGLVAGDINANSIYTATWNGTNFQVDVHRTFFTQLAGQIQNSQVPLSALLQWEASLIIGFNQLNGQLLQAQVPNSLNLPASPTTTTQAVGDISTRIATTGFVNSFVQRGIVHVGDIVNPTGGSVTFPHAFATNAIVSVSLIDANAHAASAVAAVDGQPTTGGFNWAAREIASAVEDAYIHWIAVAS